MKISVPKDHPIAGQNLSLRTSVQELGAGKVKARWGYLRDGDSSAVFKEAEDEQYKQDCVQ